MVKKQVDAPKLLKEGSGMSINRAKVHVVLQESRYQKISKKPLGPFWRVAQL